jgi:hypothetical protein
MSEATAAAPTERNALLTFLLPALCSGAAFPLGNFLGSRAV